MNKSNFDFIEIEEFYFSLLNERTIGYRREILDFGTGGGSINQQKDKIFDWILRKVIYHRNFVTEKTVLGL